MIVKLKYLESNLRPAGNPNYPDFIAALSSRVQIKTLSTTVNYMLRNMISDLSIYPLNISRYKSYSYYLLRYLSFSSYDSTHIQVYSTVFAILCNTEPWIYKITVPLQWLVDDSNLSKCKTFLLVAVKEIIKLLAKPGLSNQLDFTSTGHDLK